jgi:hypothetical protein
VHFVEKIMKAQKTNIYNKNISFTFCILILVVFWPMEGDILVMDNKGLLYEEGDTHHIIGLISWQGYKTEMAWADAARLCTLTMTQDSRIPGG